MSSKLCVGCLIVVILSLIKLAITSSPLKVHQTWGSMGTNSWVQNNNSYKLHEKEWKYTFFSHNVPFPHYYAAVIFPTSAKHVYLHSRK
jgi:hypothetical protein